MFTTSLAVVAVAGLFAPSSIPSHPDWAPNYGSALIRAAENKKPVAVFITNGNLAHLTKGVTLGADVSKTLSNHYNAVQIDATTEAGKKMADAFGIQEGVVISDRTGELMALRHEGTIAPTDLEGYLTRYSDQTGVAATEYRSSVVPTQPTITYQPQAVTYQPQAVPSYSPTVFAQPMIGTS